MPATTVNQAVVADEVVITELPVATDQVLLVNVVYPNETVCLPVETRRGTLGYSGETVTFFDGHLLTDRETADQVLAASSHTREEPLTGYLFRNEETGFSTRIPEVYDAYLRKKNAGEF